MAFEWTPIRPDEASNEFSMGDIIALVYEYQEQLRELVREYLGRNVFLEEWPLDAEPAPYWKRINKIERNLRHLVGTDVPEEMTPTKT